MVEGQPSIFFAKFYGFRLSIGWFPLYKYMEIKGKIPDQLKAVRRGNREADFEIFGPGFHSKHTVVKSKKAYNRRRNKQFAIEY